MKRKLTFYKGYDKYINGSDIVCPAVLEMVEQDGSYPPRGIYSASYINMPGPDGEPRFAVVVQFENNGIQYELDEGTACVYVPEQDVLTFSSRGVQYTIRALQDYDSSWLRDCDMYLEEVERKVENLNGK